ncbi:hypothetical protein J2Z69_000610 [Paenibacillus shirakamiensis]|uniref:Multi-tm2 domain protein n=2 Tax=Paenibacillus shirakamiensis TaxID=1265935 RepID=A0ABS4JEN4_9BACL|nr:hypothetical protein [Paenibacillus shirakamiensis]
MINNDDSFFGVASIFAVIVWIISMCDLIILLLSGAPALSSYAPHTANLNPTHNSSQSESSFTEGYISAPSMQQVNRKEGERFYTILLSFVPGLGHLHMGLMQRGLSFLIAFFGMITMLFFVSGITNSDAFLLFLGILPIIWLYSMFDAVQLVHRRQAGEIIVDRTLFDDWEAGKEEGKRSKVLATMLSAIPGAGQMYLGVQKRGLQLMVLFFGSFYIIDVLRLSLFLFLLPVIWFYSFFDGMQMTSRYGREPLVDKPLVEGLGNHQRWLGMILIVLGIYYVAMNLVVPVIDKEFPNLYLSGRIDKYFRPFVVAVVLIAGGLRLLAGDRRGTSKPAGPNLIPDDRRNHDDESSR